MKIDIKRLHEVHKDYPLNPRRQGKTIYCFDSILRATQTDSYETLAHLSSTMDKADYHFKEFQRFLDSQNEKFEVIKQHTIKLNGTIVRFISKDLKKNRGYYGYINDLDFMDALVYMTL